MNQEKKVQNAKTINYFSSYISNSIDTFGENEKDTNQGSRRR